MSEFKKNWEEDSLKVSLEVSKDGWATTTDSCGEVTIVRAREIYSALCEYFSMEKVIQGV